MNTDLIFSVPVKWIFTTWNYSQSQVIDSQSHIIVSAKNENEAWEKLYSVAGRDVVVDEFMILG